MTESPDKTPVRNCGSSSDLRTFFIALLTSLIVVVLYHCGGVLCRMFCSPCPAKPPVRYMLVPVMDDARVFHHAKMKKHFPAPTRFRPADCPASAPACPKAPAASAPAPAPQK